MSPHRIVLRTHADRLRDHGNPPPLRKYDHATDYPSLEPTVHSALDFDAGVITAARDFCHDHGIEFSEAVEKDVCKACFSYPAAESAR